MTIEEKSLLPTESKTPEDEPELLPEESDTPAETIGSPVEVLPEETPIPITPPSNPIPASPASVKPAVEAQSSSWRYFLAGMSLTIMAVALGAVLGYLARPALDSRSVEAAAQPQPQPTTQAAPAAAAPAAAPTATVDTAQIIANVVQKGGHSQGSPDAPVVIVEYADFQCPYCERHFKEVESQLKDTYVKNGQVRLVYKHYAFLGQESVWAALAAECAGEQNKFWEFHDLLFSRQKGENQGAFNQDTLKSWAAELKLDTKAFNQCFDSGKDVDIVKANTEEGQQLGIRGTPGFFVNDVPIGGAESLEVFKKVIDEKLKAQ